MRFQCLVRRVLLSPVLEQRLYSVAMTISNLDRLLCSRLVISWRSRLQDEAVHGCEDEQLPHEAGHGCEGQREKFEGFSRFRTKTSSLEAKEV